MEDGTEKWHFESHEMNIGINPVDKRLFWWTQMGAAGIWIVFTFLNLIRLSFFWGVCSGIALSLTTTNYWGYHKCSADQQNKLNSIIAEQQSGLAKFAWNTLSKGYNFFGQQST